VIVVSILEAPAVVPGLDDIAVVGQSIEQRGRHLGVADHGKMPPSLMEWYRTFGLFPAVMHCLGRSFR
jgi:hypothetical protein